MMRLATLGILAAVLALPVSARADGGDGGSRQVAGGGHMSSYISDPYHDPRSSHSQRMGTGQILGQPMISDMPRTTVARRDVIAPNWASSPAPRRAKR